MPMKVMTRTGRNAVAVADVVVLQVTARNPPVPNPPPMKIAIRQTKKQAPRPAAKRTSATAINRQKPRTATIVRVVVVAAVVVVQAQPMEARQ